LCLFSVQYTPKNINIYLSNPFTSNLLNLYDITKAREGEITVPTEITVEMKATTND